MQIIIHIIDGEFVEAFRLDNDHQGDRVIVVKQRVADRMVMETDAKNWTPAMLRTLKPGDPLFRAVERQGIDL